MFETIADVRQRPRASASVARLKSWNRFPGKRNERRRTTAAIIRFAILFQLMIAAVVQVSKLVWKLKTLRLSHSPTILSLAERWAVGRGALNGFPNYFRDGQALAFAVAFLSNIGSSLSGA